MIEFHLDGQSGVSPYLQIVQQVRHAMRLGLLKQDDQLPTVKDVVAQLAINPNTVLKAYRGRARRAGAPPSRGGHLLDPDADRHVVRVPCATAAGARPVADEGQVCRP